MSRLCEFAYPLWQRCLLVRVHRPCHPHGGEIGVDEKGRGKGHSRSAGPITRRGELVLRQNAMAKPKHFGTVVAVGMTIVVSLYASFGMLGYLVFGDAVQARLRRSGFCLASAPRRTGRSGRLFLYCLRPAGIHYAQLARHGALQQRQAVALRGLAPEPCAAVLSRHRHCRALVLPKVRARGPIA